MRITRKVWALLQISTDSRQYGGRQTDLEASRRKPGLLAIYAMILGVDIGPKLTPYGSLATLLWLGILARYGIRISWWHYVRENWRIALITLLMPLSGLIVTYWLR